MLLFICLLAFCFLPSISAKAGDAVDIPHQIPTSIQHQTHAIKSPKNAAIAHGNAETDSDLNVIKHFVGELVTIAPVLFPALAAIDFSWIPSALFGDGQQQQQMASVPAPWVTELAKTKEAIEKDVNGKPWADLLHKLRQIIGDAISTLNGDEKMVEKGKIKELSKEVKETAKELAALDKISENEITEPLKEEVDQLSMLKEMGQILDELKMQFGKANDQSDGRQRVKRMLKLIMHFPIEAVNGLANLDKGRQSGRRRHRRYLPKSAQLPVLISVFVLVGLSFLVAICYGRNRMCGKRPTPVGPTNA